MKRKLAFLKIIRTLIILTAVISLSNCGTTKETITVSDEEKAAFNQIEGDTISISGEETEYEIIIIEPGFNVWLASVAKPEGYYSQSFLESRNQIWVQEWNQRVLLPQRYSTLLYELKIDYDRNIDYGYEVNYKLYNYLVYFQRKYNQRLNGFFPRI